MKLPFLVRHSLAAMAALGTLVASGGRAVAQIAGADPAPSLLSGLTVSLSTSGYKFIIPADPAPAVVAPASFTASASIYNRSAADIPFTFPNPAAADRKFTFRVFDKAGALVWESDAEVVTPQVLTDAKLAKSARWSRTLAIPLKPGGTALAPGVYTLEAVIDADKKPGAAAIFEVAAPPDPAQEQGINGLVLKPNPPEAANPLPAEIPAAGALVNVVELRTLATPLNRSPFAWSGRTNDAGRFTVKTPAGRFRVTATLPAGTAAGALNSPSVTRTIEVVVEAGKFSDVTVHLPAPPVISGIRGLVLAGPLSPVAIAGVPNEGPAAGARVTIDEILPDPNPTARAAFRWVGVTGRDGRFQAVTPAGKFRVTASLAPATPAGNARAVTTPSASAEVTVEAGKISDVTLHIDTGLR